jgi:hypothetical protein
VKQKFYIDNDNDAERCGDSLRLGQPVSVVGEDPFTGRIKPYKGIVLAVERGTAEALGERWTVAIETELEKQSSN